MILPRRPALVLALALPAAARAQEGWPNRPIRLVVPFAPGGSSDVLARLIQPGLAAALGQPVVVENRPGAGSLLGAEFVARSPADGHTLLLADLPFAILPAIQDRLPYDPIADFERVSAIGVAPLMMFVPASLPVRSIAEFVALAQSRPEGLTYGSGGVGAASHLAGELFQRASGIRLTHVPYRGGGPAMQDLAAGRVQATFVTLATALPQVQAGQVRPLGVMGTARLPALPDVPTFREAGIDLVAEHWWGIMAPGRTPAGIVARLAEALARVVTAPDLTPRLEALAVLPRAEGPADFDRLVRADIARLAELARAQNIRAQ
ncbi:MAG: tripartite tricarboxylate transporter substrate binding protein [Rhodovarius sp.]|nr:tripartite tricarboxylate transporter substrate binding protein [Rhodovarius sp.]